MYSDPKTLSNGAAAIFRVHFDTAKRSGGHRRPSLLSTLKFVHMRTVFHMTCSTLSVVSGRLAGPKAIATQQNSRSQTKNERAIVLSYYEVSAAGRQRYGQARGKPVIVDDAVSLLVASERRGVAWRVSLLQHILCSFLARRDSNHQINCLCVGCCRSRNSALCSSRCTGTSKRRGLVGGLVIVRFFGSAKQLGFVVS